MWSLYRTLSVRYVSRRWLRAALVALSIALGVATLVATQSLNWTMARAAVLAANPTSGFADLIVANGDLPVPRSLEKALAAVPGVASVDARIFGNAFAPQLDGRAIMVIGIDAAQAMKKSGASNSFTISEDTKSSIQGIAIVAGFGGPAPMVVGRALFDELKDIKLFRLRSGQAVEPTEFCIAGPVDAMGDSAYLAGYVVMIDLNDAAKFFSLNKSPKDGRNEDFVNRFDLTLKPNADPIKTRADVEKVLGGRALVGTFGEQSQTTQSVIAGLQTGFSLCGIAALVVGLFLVYNALSVTVTERRHEIGILRSLGATRSQILLLFAGEAMLLGIIGSLLGIPLGIALANIGLGPMRSMLCDIFYSVDAKEVYVSWLLYGGALVVGTCTTLFASLLPAFLATRERPAEAVRKVLKAASTKNLVIHVAASVLLIALGTAMILGHEWLPRRWGTVGGMGVVLVGGLLASPFVSGMLARSIQPIMRRYLGIEWRLAADNVVRSPGRTGLVIGALGAGVALVFLTAGLISSNRKAVNDWLEDSIASDLIVTSGSPVGAGGQTQPIPESVVDEVAKLDGVDSVFSVRIRKIPYRGTQIMMLAYDTGQAYRAEKPRHKKLHGIELFRQMDESPGTAIVSKNLAMLNKLRVGDSIKVPGPRGEVDFKIIGTIDDFSWTHGTLYVHRREFLSNWNDRQADVIHVFARSPGDVAKLQEFLVTRWKHSNGTYALTHDDLQKRVRDMIDKIEVVAYAQLVVVMLVAGLGVVMALLISVLQRQHEMGLLRAVGASRGQVIYSVLAEACLMGAIGTFLGIVVGVPMEWYCIKVVIPEDAGMLFPVALPWLQAMSVAVGAVLTAIIAGMGPALYAVRQRIPDSIAFE